MKQKVIIKSNKYGLIVHMDPERIHTEEKRSGCDVRRGGRPKRRPDRDTSGAVPEYPPVPDGRTVPDYRSAGDRA